jgi:hypothetical protein
VRYSLTFFPLFARQTAALGIATIVMRADSGQPTHHQCKTELL